MAKSAPKTTLQGLAKAWKSVDCPFQDDDLDLLEELAEGRRCREIAIGREVTLYTVYGHLAHLRDVIGVADRAQLVIVAFLAGWLRVEEIEVP